MEGIIAILIMLALSVFFGGVGRLTWFLICLLASFAGSGLLALGIYHYSLPYVAALVFGLVFCVVSVIMLSKSDNKVLLLCGLYYIVIGIAFVWDATITDGLGQYVPVKIICIGIMAAVPVIAGILKYRRTGKIPGFLGFRNVSFLEFAKPLGFLDYDEKDKMPKNKIRFLEIIKPFIEEKLIKPVYEGQHLCIINFSDYFYLVCPYITVKNKYTYGVFIDPIIENFKFVAAHEEEYIVELGRMTREKINKNIAFLNPKKLSDYYEWIDRFKAEGIQKHTDPEIDKEMLTKYGPISSLWDVE